jgi:hypothetical protein
VRRSPLEGLKPHGPPPAEPAVKRPATPPSKLAVKPLENLSVTLRFFWTGLLLELDILMADAHELTTPRNWAFHNYATRKTWAFLRLKLPANKNGGWKKGFTAVPRTGFKPVPDLYPRGRPGPWIAKE